MFVIVVSCISQESRGGQCGFILSILKLNKMERKDRVLGKEEGKYSPIFKGYLVKTKKERVVVEQHFIVPWELTKDENKRIVH